MSSEPKKGGREFKSLCSDLLVDAPNYLAEIVCVRKAEKENSGALPEKFWNMPKYKNLYIREVSQARNLLKTYPAKVIIQAIQSFEAKWILSYRNKKLIPILNKYLKTHKEVEVEINEQKELVSQKPLLKNNPFDQL